VWIIIDQEHTHRLLGLAREEARPQGGQGAARGQVMARCHGAVFVQKV